MQRHLVLFTALFALTLAEGCSRSSADRAPATREPEASEAASDTSGRAYTVTGVSLDPDLRSGCGIKGVQTFFEYDSTDVEPPEDTVLYQLAHCLSEGPLQGRKVRVVGHTDPRGSDRYNDELGKSRAQAVREYLVNHGVDHTAIEMLSMGEAMADEGNPAEWPFDRRVSIRLMPKK
jgi:peptidoglycan-associated lipoprotein